MPAMELLRASSLQVFLQFSQHQQTIYSHYMSEGISPGVSLQGDPQFPGVVMELSVGYEWMYLGDGVDGAGVGDFDALDECVRVVCRCKNVNFAKRLSCNRCGKEKTAVPARKVLGQEIGKVAAEKSRGLFSAEDWLCGRCGNVNWARRTQCNMCNAPRFGELEERTGLGGGYNERENVEYIDRSESDGEYDDFGRKKKKLRPKSSSSPQKVKKSEEEEDDDEEEEDGDVSKYKLESEDEEDSPAVSRPVVKKDDDDEEEEDDEEVDLSKYDLSGWGDDSSEEAKDSKKRKRSRSSTILGGLKLRENGIDVFKEAFLFTCVDMWCTYSKKQSPTSTHHDYN
ncbi:ZRANB2 [Cordylochernes scorpioides]|uniref:ZRANB2 n=1 Tax=Cordylochernes scorpioides TaxID=51811 RepID=A0ABY6LGY0_9ARAC|nr:ZRANB2 [Cordylochernes scorpioides]